MSARCSRSFSFNRDLNHWDVRAVTNMVGMFDSASSFNGDISSWDVSGVRDMSGMFFNATSFNQDIGGWDVGMVEWIDRKSTRLNSSHVAISYAVLCLKKKNN